MRYRDFGEKLAAALVQSNELNPNIVIVGLEVTDGNEDIEGVAWADGNIEIYTAAAKSE